MEAPICALVDAMFRLPTKLDTLLVRRGHMLPRGAAAEISLLKQDLGKMVAILQEQDESGAQDRTMIVRCLTKEVRELSYDMEDCVDQYEHATGTRRWILSPRSRKYKITRRRGKAAWRPPEKLKWRLWMANKIREFSARLQEALQRYSLFDHPGGNEIASSSSTASTSTRCDPSFGSWHPTPYKELVGIDVPLKRLEAWLDKNGEHNLKVVSVVGPGGVGKTTLTSKLYRRIGHQFECRAFVRTSRKPDVRRLLISMLSQVRPHQTPHNWKVHNLIADIRTHLQDKRLPKRSIQMQDPSTDGFKWRKYGQKKILGSTYPRTYFRCIYKHNKGCQATKQVKRLDNNAPNGQVLYDVVYHGEHTCTDSAHLRTESACPPPNYIFESEVISPVTSESLVTYDAVSSSGTAGTSFFPSTSSGSQVTNEGVSRSTARIRFMSPGTSESQVTYQEISGCTDGFWSMPDDVDSTPNSPMDDMLDLNADFVDYTDYPDSKLRL